MCLKNGFFLALLAAFLFGCSPDPDKVVYSYSRQPYGFGGDTTESAHPFCQQSGEVEDCNATRKYRLTWNRPDDTVNLRGYRIYLGLTSPPGAPGQKWETVQNKPELASIIVERHAFSDSVVFVFGNSGFRQDTLRKGEDRIFQLDSVGREDSTGWLYFGLVPVYSDDGVPGLPRITGFVTGDKEPPLPFHPRYKAMSKSLSVEWERPTDPTSFFDPSLDTGRVAGYVLMVTPDGVLTPARKKAFNPRISSYLVRDEEMAEAAEKSRTFDSASTTYRFFLPDSGRASKRVVPDSRDSLKLLIGNLAPKDTLKVFIYGVDSIGNTNQKGMEKITLLTTDSTQPSKPGLRADLDSITTNSFKVVWTASRDSMPGPDGNLVEAERPNAFIQSYRLARIALRDTNQTAATLARVDTIIEPDSAARISETMHFSARFLPPGTSFQIRLYAVDSTGFESPTDSLTIRTKPVRFAGSDSVLTCPPGFVPIPGSDLKLGDDRGGAQGDETPRIVGIGPFCIEPYEHRDTGTGRFLANLTHEQAKLACEEINPDFSTRLCSEAQWERACEGPNPDAPLLHGIQSEGSNASILQTHCNQATNDSVMAMSLEKRNAVCLTTEGVYDMAGNLAEWVMDTYRPDAYAQVSGDSLAYGYAYQYPDPVQEANAPRGFRGGYYLKSDVLQEAQTQNSARCSNREFAQQIRPKYREDCKDSAEVKIALIYGPGLEGHRCIPIPDTLAASEITELRAAPRDSSSILAFMRGKAIPVTISLDTADLDVPLDSAVWGKKPTSVQLTNRSLAIVEFVSADGSRSFPDTLDALEMRDTTQAGLAKIFAREASNPGWTVKKENGNYKIRYAYAYATLGAKPAKASHSSRAIGFRCCSMALPAPDTAVAESH